MSVVNLGAAIRSLGVVALSTFVLACGKGGGGDSYESCVLTAVGSKTDEVVIQEVKDLCDAQFPETKGERPLDAGEMERLSPRDDLMYLDEFKAVVHNANEALVITSLRISVTSAVRDEAGNPQEQVREYKQRVWIAPLSSREVVFPADSGFQGVAKWTLTSASGVERDP